LTDEHGNSPDLQEYRPRSAEEHQSRLHYPVPTTLEEREASRQRFIAREFARYRNRPLASWTHIVHVAPAVLLFMVFPASLVFLDRLFPNLANLTNIPTWLSTIFLLLWSANFVHYLWAAAGLSLLAYALIRPPRWKSYRRILLWSSVGILAVFALLTPAFASLLAYAHR
jgi:hypothetical protein